MEFIFHLFSRDSEAKSGRADSFADKLSSKYTVSLLSIFALLSSTRLFIDEPISCYCPAELPSSQIDFLEKTCWTQETYHIPVHDSIQKSKLKVKISYYQWVPLILAFQAFLFYLPSPMWKILSKKSGMALSSVTDASNSCQKCPDDEESEGIIKFTANTISNYLRSLGKHASRKGLIENLLWTPNGNYLSFLYIFMKCVYMVNAVGQLYILNAFLGQKYTLYGFEVLKNMQDKKNWFSSKRFPRYTVCIVPTRAPGNIQEYTIQCALPMNMMYEMMFLIIWFWLIFVMVVTAYSLLKWVANVFVGKLRFDYVLEMICQSGILVDTYADSERYGASLEDVKNFVRNYLKRDGCFILQMVDENSGGWVTANITSEVWQKYQERKLAKGAQKELMDLTKAKKYLEVVKTLSDEGIEMDKASSSFQNTSIDEDDELKID